MPPPMMTTSAAGGTGLSTACHAQPSAPVPASCCSPLMLSADHIRNRRSSLPKSPAPRRFRRCIAATITARSGRHGRICPEPRMKNPVTVTITGAAGHIGYALAFRVASGQMLGPDQPVNLSLLEITPALAALNGVVMELNDCAFPTLNTIVATDDPRAAFKDCGVGLLVGARPRGPGMERKDLLLANAQIFSVQGKAINEVAARDIKVLVVGNPANTNALITASNAPDIERGRFTAM